MTDSAQFLKLPVCRIYNDQILTYEQFATLPPRSDRQKANEQNLTRGEFNGFMSPKTKSKVRKYLSTWIDSGLMIRKSGMANNLDKIPYFTFVTLTLPAQQTHTDNEIKRKCLTPFIATLQRKFNVWHYFWRAESQKNGNIHFHLIIDSFIAHGRLRAEWNACINKLGYVDRFQAKYQHSNPNSTDIHSFKNIHSPASYVIKYCCKQDGYRKIDGRIHGCSDGLKVLKPYEQLIDHKLALFLHHVENDPEAKVFTSEEYKIIKCSTRHLMEKY